MAASAEEDTDGGGFDHFDTLASTVEERHSRGIHLHAVVDERALGEIDDKLLADSRRSAF